MIENLMETIDHDLFEKLKASHQEDRLQRINFTSMQDAREIVDLMQRQVTQLEKMLTDTTKVLASIRKELNCNAGESVLESIRKLRSSPRSS